MQTFPYWIGFGDIHEQTANVRRIPELGEAAAVLVSGDLTNRGRRNAVERIIQDIQRVNPRVYAQIGNMDFPEVEDFLRQQGMNIHARGLDLGNGVGLMGVGYSTPTPFGTPGEVSDEQLGVWLAQAHEPVKHLPHLLLVAHNPPYGTATDKVDGRIPVGSRAVRDFIEAFQPQVCLTGHIHEARAADHIGKTQVINPGPLAGGGYALIRLTEEGLQGELRMISQGAASRS